MGKRPAGKQACPAGAKVAFVIPQEIRFDPRDHRDEALCLHWEDFGDRYQEIERHEFIVFAPPVGAILSGEGDALRDDLRRLLTGPRCCIFLIPSHGFEVSVADEHARLKCPYCTDHSLSRGKQIPLEDTEKLLQYPFGQGVTIRRSRRDWKPETGRCAALNGHMLCHKPPYAITLALDENGDLESGWHAVRLTDPGGGEHDAGAFALVSSQGTVALLLAFDDSELVTDVPQLILTAREAEAFRAFRPKPKRAQPKLDGERKAAATSLEARFDFAAGQVLFDGRDLGLPTGLPVEVMRKLFDSFGQTVSHQALDLQSSESEASEELRHGIRAIRKSLRAHKVPCQIQSKRADGYVLVACHTSPR
jgi:hypothetical protein